MNTSVTLRRAGSRWGGSVVLPADYAAEHLDLGYAVTSNREWLTCNVSYTQMEQCYHGLTTRAPGPVIIGRDDPAAERQASRARSEEAARIAVHSWDWLLRGARNLSGYALCKTKFAVDNLNEQVGKQVVSLPVSSASRFDELFDEDEDEDEDEEFNRLQW